MAERFFTQLKTPEEPVITASEPETPALVDSNIQGVVPADPTISLPALKPTARPASAMNTEPTEEGRQGFWDALMHGDDPTKEDGFGSIVGSSLTDFVRNGVDAGYELFDDQRMETRKQLDKLRAYDPAMADMIEADIGGKKKTTTQNVIRLAASLGEAALTIIPFFSGAKGVGAAAKAGEAVNAASKVSKAGVVARTLTKIPGMSEEFALHVATGFKYGVGFGGLDTLSKEADFSDALRDASIGGALGMALPFLGRGAGKAAGLVSENAGKVFNKFGQVGFQLNKFLEQNPKTMVVYKVISPIGGTMKTYFGETGAAFVNMYNKANQIAQIEISDLAGGMVENGLLKPPGVAKNVFKNVPYIAENKELMTEANLALRGMGMYKDPAVRNAFLEKNPAVKFIDQKFKQYGVDAEHQGLLSATDKLENYLPKYTPAVELKSNLSNKISAAGSQAEREALYASNSADVQWMVENAVFNEKAFKTLEEGYGVYYDWANFVAEGGRMGVNDNKFLQWMVTEGKAKTIEEAEGKLIRQMKYRESGSVSKKASSLDFDREVDMPFYDVNPARVLSNYGNEVITRVNNSKVFGANDEVINELVAKVKNEKGLSQANAFSELVDKAMKGSTSGRVAEDISAWIRGIQVFKIGFSTILQIPQNLNTLVSTDFKSFAYGIGQAFKDEGVQRALKDGALMNSFIREMHQQTSGSIGGTKIADKFLNMIGLTRLDSFNRIVASNAGELYAQREFAALLEKNAATGQKAFRSIASPEAKRLEELGINVTAAIKRGSLNEEDLTLAGYAIAKESQFLGRPIDLPYFASSASGKVIMQFRTFAYQQGTFLKQQIWDDLAGRGDFKRGMRNLTIFATIFPLGGEVVADIRSMLTNSKRPPIGFSRYVDNILSAGGFGLAYDSFKAARTGRLHEFFVGAGISDAINLVQNTVKIPDDGGKALLKQGINALPFGRAVTNRIWPSKSDGKSMNQQIMEWLK